MTNQPSKREQVEPLLEALEYIAKMVKQRGAFNQNDIPMLLSTSGVDPEWGEDQLKRWAKILKAVCEDSSKLQLGQTALMKFGIPEAHAMLAVSMVSTGASQPGPLSASKSRLDFGILSSGEPVKAEFEVEGGPGEIIVESDRVRVDPRQFSGGNTKVRLEISPLKSGLLWSSIKLVAANETVELPVMAQWSDVPRTYSQQTLVVDANGGGDCNTIEEAVQKAQAGATIELTTGVYHLSLPLQIDKPLVLVGEGMDLTKIVCEAEGYVVKYTGDGLFLAHDLTFDHQGFQWANVVEVVTGEIDFRRCRFTGGFFDAGGNRGVAGLYLLGDVRGSVAECEVSNNGLHGICVANQAQPTLEANTCQGNKYTGIAYSGNATGTARQNTCTANELHGIAVQEQAQPTLEANTCQGNKYGGIAYFGNGTGTARQNTCTGNETNAISVQGEAQPVLEANTCQGNKYRGIAYSGNATGTASQNTCIGNEIDGISVQEQAQPTLEANTCQRNKQDGIYYSGNATGTARQNTCIDNDNYGINLREQAQPILEANTCQGNKQSGIVYSGNATGTARQNTCTGNETNGISVKEQAQPTLEANTCQGNKYGGIVYFGNAAGTARQNTCTGNEMIGISVQEQAQPTLEVNTCQGNNCGIVYFENATGTARKNTCTRNEMYGIYVVSTADPILENNYCDDNQQKNLEDQR